MVRSLALRPRYLPLYTRPGEPVAEKNYRFRELDWEIPSSQIALVPLDVWNVHLAQDTFDRIESVTREKVVPVLGAWRRAGLQVIHAPEPFVAYSHPNWVNALGANPEPQPGWEHSPEWPTPAFRKKTGEFAPYARPFEPQEEARHQMYFEDRTFHPLVRPQGDEPVIANGEELHRVCARHKILFLVYVGFNTNVCMVRRDYGIVAMEKRGYDCILLRDCTTGMENHETYRDLTCTRGAIATLEQLGTYTLLSEQLISALGESLP